MVKLTLKRQVIYDILKQNDAPLSAEDIHAKLKNEQMNLSTVYRTLEFFYKEHMVSRNYLDNKAYFYLNHDDHHHFLLTCALTVNRRILLLFLLRTHGDELLQQNRADGKNDKHVIIGIHLL